MQFSKISKGQALKVLKTAGYVAASAVIGYLLTLVTNQPELFGIYAPLVNVALVTLKQLVTPTGE